MRRTSALGFLLLWPFLILGFMFASAVCALQDEWGGYKRELVRRWRILWGRA